MGSDLVQILPAARAAQPHAADEPSTGAAGEFGRTFYIETFGCQMNVHDSEKVAGVLMSRGIQP
ncbi:MAG TPA: hypothetical protein VL523_01230, partial [Terriglobia bacterium]|nr:hypothetical protein [Terriglobia bacterium]